MEKRVVFRSAWLPYALVAPQIAITIVFFFWPAAQAVWYSFQLQDAFGFKTQFVGLANFAALFRDGNYLDSFEVTAIGSPDGLAAAIERPGGILSLYEQSIDARFTVSQVNRLELPATQRDLTPAAARPVE